MQARDSLDGVLSNNEAPHYLRNTQTTSTELVRCFRLGFAKAKPNTQDLLALLDWAAHHVRHAHCLLAVSYTHLTLPTKA